jgi:hypothetical protein
VTSQWVGPAYSHPSVPGERKGLANDRKRVEWRVSSEPPMTPLGHLRRLGDVRATSDLPPRAARLDPLINCGTDQNEPSFTLVLVESGSVPKAIEFVLNTQPMFLARDLSLSRGSR